MVNDNSEIYRKENVWFGSQLRKWRETAHLSQAELARRIGTTRASISNWEYRIAAPHPYKVKIICEKLGITPNAFYECEDDAKLSELEESWISLSDDEKDVIIKVAKLLSQPRSEEK